MRLFTFELVGQSYLWGKAGPAKSLDGVVRSANRNAGRGAHHATYQSYTRYSTLHRATVAIIRERNINGVSYITVRYSLIDSGHDLHENNGLQPVISQLCMLPGVDFCAIPYSLCCFHVRPADSSPSSPSTNTHHPSLPAPPRPPITAAKLVRA